MCATQKDTIGKQHISIGMPCKQLYASLLLLRQFLIHIRGSLLTAQRIYLWMKMIQQPKHVYIFHGMYDLIKKTWKCNTQAHIQQGNFKNFEARKRRDIWLFPWKYTLKLTINNLLFQFDCWEWKSPSSKQSRNVILDWLRDILKAKS